MIAHTNAFIKLREQTQATLNFSILMCSAVPFYKENLDIEKRFPGKITFPVPDYFKGTSKLNDLLEFIKTYKENLSKYVLLSNFSFFEAYVEDAIKEIFKFHSGAEKMILRAKRLSKESFNIKDKNIIANKRKLQDALDKKKTLKYRTSTRLLKGLSYKFPCDLMSAYGILQLEKVSKNFKSFHITDLLNFALNLDLTNNEIKMFHDIRNIRNDIAHGNQVSLSIEQTMIYNNFLRDLSVKIDSHIVNHFFIIEEFI
jgi:hypothetical protein